jgi:hypothetical protein
MITLSSKTQQFTVTPRDNSASFDNAETVIRQQLAATPDATLVDTDASNRIAIIEAPEGSMATIREALGDEFLVDLNAPLRF